MERVRSLNQGYTKDEIEERIREMTSEIREYREEYGCEEPEDLVVGMDKGEGSEVWNTVSDWKTTRRNLAVAKTALAFKQVLAHSEEEEVRSEGVPS